MLFQTLLLLSLTVVGASLSETASSISWPESLIDNAVATPTFKFLVGGQNEHFDMQVAVLYAPKGLCAKQRPDIKWPASLPANYTGKIAILFRSTKADTNNVGDLCTNGEQFTLAVKSITSPRNVSAAIFRGYYTPVGAVAFEVYGNPKDLLDFPAVLLASSLHDKIEAYLLADDGNRHIMMRLQDSVNAWDGIFTGAGWIFFQLSSGLLYLASFYFACERLYIFVKEVDKGFKLTISQVVLIMEIIGNFIRVFFIIDPFGKHGIYTFPVARWLVSASLPFNLGSMILLVLYFKNLTSSITAASKFFQQRSTQIIFGGISLWLVLSDWVAFYFNVVLLNDALNFVILLQIAIVNIVLTISYWRMGNAVLTTMKKGASSKSGTGSDKGAMSPADKKIQTMSTFVRLNSLCSLAFIISTLGYTFAALINPTLYIFFVTCVGITIGFQSLLVILSFQVKSAKNQKMAQSPMSVTKKQSVAGADSSKSAFDKSTIQSTMESTRSNPVGPM